MSCRICLFTAVLFACPIPAADPEPAFDGKTLNGWNYSAGHWKAENDAIVGTSDGKLKNNTFLCTKRKFKDFEMTLKVKLTSAKTGDANTANSGIQIRSEVMDMQKWIVKGPQCDMGGAFWGSLYGEQFGGMMKASDMAKLKPTLKFDDFNDYYIHAAGKHITIKVNGVTTVDAEFDTMPAEGIIALQMHQGPPMQAVFKDIKFRELK